MFDPKQLDAWREGIFKGVVEVGKFGKPLFLYIDSEILGEISNLLPGVAQEEFAKCFLKYYKKAPYDSAFENAVTEAIAWPKTLNYRSDEPPQILPLLALCVIAVTDKSPSPGQSVYFLLNKLLGIDETLGKPHGYELIPEVWAIWNKWLLNGGARYGKPTARVTDHYALQGYSRSQGFVRRRERLFITDFFSESGIEPGIELQNSYLLNIFQTWLRSHGRKGVDFYNKIFESKEEVTQEIFSEILVNEFENWDGLTQTEIGTASLIGHLAKSEFEDDWEILCAVRKKIIGIEMDLGNGCVTVEESWPFISVAQVETKVISEVLTKGTNFKLNSQLSIKAGGRDYYIFANRKFGFDGLVEERNPKLLVPYVLLVESKNLEDMIYALEVYEVRHAEPELNKDIGYFQFDNLVFTKRNIDEGIKTKYKFPIDPPPIILLQGGLRVGKNQYEDKYPPKLQLPFDRQNELFINGNLVTFSNDIDLLDLTDFKLKKGLNKIVYGGSNLHFYLVEFKKIKPSSSSSGIPLVNISGSIKLGSMNSSLESSKFRIRGASFPRANVPAENNYISMPYEFTYSFLLTEKGDFKQIVINDAKRTNPTWRSVLGISESKLNSDLLLHTFSGRAYLFFKEASKRNCTVLEIDGKKNDHESAPRYISQSANKAIESILLSRWKFAEDSISLEEESLRERLQAIRNSGAMTQMNSSSEIFERIRKMNNAQVWYGPLDFLLEWISEQDKAFVSFDDFEEAWLTVGADSFHKYSLESALYLEELGHLEVDIRNKKILVHPAVANILQGEGDYAVLTGARPYLMQQILMGEHRELVENPSLFDKYLEYQLRTQPYDARNCFESPMGPAVAMIKSNDFFDKNSQGVLQELEIETCYNAGTKYLHFCTTVSELPLIGQKYDVSLSNRFERLRGVGLSQNQISDSWVSVTSDSDPGIYRYVRSGSSKPIAVRFCTGEPLSEVDPRWARYIFIAYFELFTRYSFKDYSFAQIPSLIEIPSERMLFVPIGIPLPRIVSRGLILQSGLPVEKHEKGYLYQNIKKGEVAEISRILEFARVEEYGYVRRLRTGSIDELESRFGVLL